jgi:hypothetical protein
MKLADHLSKEQKQQLRKIGNHKKKRKQKKDWFNTGGKTEKPMSRKDWEEIMGVHRDTYERRNGAVRRK